MPPPKQVNNLAAAAYHVLLFPLQMCQVVILPPCLMWLDLQCMPLRPLASTGLEAMKHSVTMRHFIWPLWEEPKVVMWHQNSKSHDCRCNRLCEWRLLRKKVVWLSLSSGGVRHITNGKQEVLYFMVREVPFIPVHMVTNVQETLLP